MRTRTQQTKFFVRLAQLGRLGQRSMLASVLLVGCHSAGASSAPTVSPPGAAAQLQEGTHEGLAQPPASLADLEYALEQAAKSIAPSVVSITSARVVSRDIPAFLKPFGPPDGEVKGMGSGFIIDDEGHILTNNHVVEDADRLVVRLDDDREFQAEVVGRDPKTDIAVIRIEAADLHPAVLGHSGNLRVGQWVMAAGSPFGLPKTVTAGIVSAVERGDMGIADYGDFIQTDAAVNQGNSGGPLIGLDGAVVGMNTAIASRNGGSNGIGFAIPIDLARSVMTQLITEGVVRRGWLGIVMGELDDELAASFDYQSTDGILVNDTDPEGPAHKAGLRSGDIITSLDGKNLTHMSELRNTVAQTKPEESIVVGIWRGGQESKVRVQLAALPGSPPPVVRKKTRVKAEVPLELGLRLVEPSAELARKLGLGTTGAVIADIVPGSIAANSNLYPGDVLVEIADKPIRSAAQGQGWLDTADLRRGLRLRVRRGRWHEYIVLKQP